MGGSTLFAPIFEALSIFLVAIGIPLGAAIIGGLLIGILQTATQIQDQTLPQSVKLFVVIAVYAAVGGSLLYPLSEFTETLFRDFPKMVR
ncbi:YtrH family sporulation protein [Thalassococcus sp. S3]|uniref:YtrH family sporulation protein n=1 Tax=Thalassococcus sp. S3 TaxID=2017482 RepID=UPI0013EE54E6|nr:YtrH family sporulation protein [Thalassococcus sp. S3]